MEGVDLLLLCHAINIRDELLDLRFLRTIKIQRMGRQNVGQAVHHLKIHRISNGQNQPAIVQAHRDHVVFGGDLWSHLLQHKWIRHKTIEVHKFHAGVDSHGLGHSVFGYPPVLDQKVEGRLGSTFGAVGLDNIVRRQMAGVLQ